MCIHTYICTCTFASGHLPQLQVLLRAELEPPALRRGAGILSKRGVRFHLIRDFKQYYFNSIPPTTQQMDVIRHVAAGFA